VSAKGGELHSVDGFEVRTARLGELPGNTANLYHRHTAGIGEYRSHLQDDLELVTQGWGGGVGKGFGAVTGLEQKRFSVGHIGEGGQEVPGFSGEHQWGQAGNLFENLIHFTCVGILGLLHYGEVAPR
jgi:hypothetical protein